MLTWAYNCKYIKMSVLMTENKLQATTPTTLFIVKESNEEKWWPSQTSTVGMEYNICWNALV